VLSVQFDWKGQRKPVTTLLVGTSPEFELALYTLCFVAGGRAHGWLHSAGKLEAGLACVVCACCWQCTHDSKLPPCKQHESLPGRYGASLQAMCSS
jgi:hypothetical protein